jgi:hypothetical protein
MPFGTGTVTFDFCADVSVQGAVMKLFRDNSTNGRSKYGVTVNKGGYCAMGFGTAMTGTTAVIAGFPTSKVLVKSGSFNTGSSFGIDNITSATKAGEHTSVTFTRTATAGASVDLVWAWGTSVGPTLGGAGANKPDYHGTGRNSGAINFASGVASDVITDREYKFRVHGALMAISWGFLVPAAIVIARFFKHKDPLWFQLHRAMQCTALLFTTVAIALAYDQGSGLEKTHYGIGTAVFVGTLIQILVAFFRPHPDTPHRPKFNLFHQNLGRIVCVLAIVNCFLGLKIYNTNIRPIGDAYTIAYAIIMGLVIALGLVLQICVVRGWQPGSTSA